ncbi:hypothetical protein JHK87_048989 [Glycine soja]|nr:hypothetical protein JHK87_048989 [Glycine soja]
MPPLSVSRSLPAASPMPSCKVALSSLSDNDKSEHEASFGTNYSFSRKKLLLLRGSFEGSLMQEQIVVPFL